MFISLMYDRNIFMLCYVLSEERTVYRIDIDKIHYRYSRSILLLKQKDIGTDISQIHITFISIIIAQFRNIISSKKFIENHKTSKQPFLPIATFVNMLSYVNIVSTCSLHPRPTKNIVSYLTRYSLKNVFEAKQMHSTPTSLAHRSNGNINCLHTYIRR